MTGPRVSSSPPSSSCAETKDDGTHFEPTGAYELRLHLADQHDRPTRGWTHERLAAEHERLHAALDLAGDQMTLF